MNTIFNTHPVLSGDSGYSEDKRETSPDQTGSLGRHSLLLDTCLAGLLGYPRWLVRLILFDFEYVQYSWVSFADFFNVLLYAAS